MKYQICNEIETERIPHTPATDLGTLIYWIAHHYSDWQILPKYDAEQKAFSHVKFSLSVSIAEEDIDDSYWETYTLSPVNEKI